MSPDWQLDSPASVTPSSAAARRCSRARRAGTEQALGTPVQLFEQRPVTAVDAGRLETPAGTIRARQPMLALNAWATGWPLGRARTRCGVTVRVREWAAGGRRRTAAALQLPLLKAPVPWVDRHFFPGGQGFRSVVWGVARRVRLIAAQSVPLPRADQGHARDRRAPRIPAAIDACLRAGRACTRWTLRDVLLPVGAGAIEGPLSAPPRARPLTFLRDETAPQRRVFTRGRARPGSSGSACPATSKDASTPAASRRAARHTVSFARSRSTALETIYAHLDHVDHRRHAGGLRHGEAEACRAGRPHLNLDGHRGVQGRFEQDHARDLGSRDARNSQERRFDLSHEN